MEREAQWVVAGRREIDALGGVDRLIAAIAGRQCGRVSHRQLVARRVTEGEVRHRLRRGRLVAEAPGVYAVGGAEQGPRQRLATGLLYAGPGSVGSWHAACAEWGMRARAPDVVDVTNARRVQPQPGIVTHQRLVDPVELRRIDGIPLTSPAQTVFDLAATLPLEALRKLANQGFVEGALTVADLRGALAHNERRKGAARFRKLLERVDPEGRRVRSPLEVRLHDFLRARRFPPWEANVHLRIGAEWIEPDVLWREQRVIVEADGRGPHLAPETFASDRRRDRRCRVERWEPVRVTSVDLDERPDELEADLRALLGLSPR